MNDNLNEKRRGVLYVQGGNSVSKMLVMFCSDAQELLLLSSPNIIDLTLMYKLIHLQWPAIPSKA